MFIPMRIAVPIKSAFRAQVAATRGIRQLFAREEGASSISVSAVNFLLLDIAAPFLSWNGYLTLLRCFIFFFSLKFCCYFSLSLGTSFVCDSFLLSRSFICAAFSQLRSYFLFPPLRPFSRLRHFKFASCGVEVTRFNQILLRPTGEERKGKKKRKRERREK